MELILYPAIFQQERVSWDTKINNGILNVTIVILFWNLFLLLITIFDTSLDGL